VSGLSEYHEVWPESDPIVNKVLQKIHSRSQAGMAKYGVTMMRDDVTTVEWLRHAQEEALDLAVYLERIIHDLSRTDDREVSAVTQGGTDAS